MAIPSVTHTFVNGTSSDAGQVNTNFTDIINSLTDGTKSLTIDALTANGAATFNGNVTLGDGTPDDLTFNGSMASTLSIKTNNSFNIGTAGFGLASVYLGSSGGFTTRLKGSATANYTATLPAAVPASRAAVTMDSSGNCEVFTLTAPIEVSGTTLRIAPGGVGTTHLADGSVTQAKREALGQQVSSSSGTYTTTSDTFAAVTNLSVSLTTTGRPVFLAVIQDGTEVTPSQANEGVFFVRSAVTSGNTEALLRFRRGSTTVSAFSYSTNGQQASTALRVGGSIVTIDIPAAGTYTYTVEIKVSTSGHTAGMVNAKLLAFEL